MCVCDRDESFGLRHHQLSVASFDSNDPTFLSKTKETKKKKWIGMCPKLSWRRYSPVHTWLIPINRPFWKFKNHSARHSALATISWISDEREETLRTITLWRRRRRRVKHQVKCYMAIWYDNIYGHVPSHHRGKWMQLLSFGWYGVRFSLSFIDWLP